MNADLTVVERNTVVSMPMGIHGNQLLPVIYSFKIEILLVRFQEEILKKYLLMGLKVWRFRWSMPCKKISALLEQSFCHKHFC